MLTRFSVCYNSVIVSWNYVELIRFVLGMTQISFVLQGMTVELQAVMFTLLYVWMRLAVHGETSPTENDGDSLLS